MKNKAPLTLMEQLIMILVFALAAAVCLQLFVLSNNMSANMATQEQALVAVQNTAESLKLLQGDFDRLPDSCGGERTAEGWKICYDKNWEITDEEKAVYTVEAAAFDDHVALMGSARVTAAERNGKQLFQVTVSWQEECDE